VVSIRISQQESSLEMRESLPICLCNVCTRPTEFSSTCRCYSLGRITTLNCST
jgi:hypothetical protein